MSEKQKDIFVNSEADQWFRRNEEHISAHGKEDTLLEDSLKQLGLSPSSALEVGCSNGHRLSRVCATLGCEGTGIEPSSEAVENGQSQFPELTLVRGSSDELPFPSASFDLVVVYFVFHWIDREVLLKTVSEVDRVLKVGGTLAVGDFFPTANQKVKYHHLENANVYTYKQKYREIFTASGLYHQSASHFFDYGSLAPGLADSPRDVCCLDIMTKTGSEFYQLVE